MQRLRRAGWRLSAVDDLQTQLHISHASRHHTHLAFDRLLAARPPEIVLVVAAPRGRLQAHDAAKRGRHPHAAANVSAQPQRRRTHCNQGRFAATGTAGSTGGVVRIESAAKHRVVALVIQQQLRHVALGDGYGPSGTQSGHLKFVKIRPVPHPRTHPESGRRSRQAEAFLDGKGHAVQQPQRQPALLARIGQARFFARRIKPLEHHRIELRVDL